MCRLELLEWQILFHYLIPKVYSDATTATSPAGIRNKDWNISSAIVLENHTFLLSLSRISSFTISTYFSGRSSVFIWWRCPMAMPGDWSESLQPCKDVHTRSHLHPAADVSNLYLYLYLYFQCIVLFINMCICICIWSKQLYICPQTAKQPCKDVHSRSSSILGQTSPNQLEFQTGLAFNLLPASAFSV